VGRAINETKEELFEEVKDVPYELPEGWRWVKLEDIVEINPESVNPVKDFSEETFTYIDISSVENYTGRITNPKIIVAKKAPSRARRLIKHRDILLSTVRPYLMAHAFVSSEYENQVCSTGFAVLRVKNEKQIYPKYLWFSLFSEALLRQYERLMMGASYPALNNNQVRALVIPLPFKDGEPDFEKQKQIVERIEALFKEIGKTIELRQKAIEETKNLFESVLDRIFREAEKDKENWKWVRLGSIGRIFSGTSAPQDKKYFNEGKCPFIRVSDLGKYGKTTDLKECRDYINDLAVKEKKLVKAREGTIIFPKSGAAILTNNRGILGVDAYVVSHLACLEVHNDFDNHFVFYMLCNLDFSKIINNSSYPSLTLKEIKEIRIPIPFKDGSPDLKVQRQIAEYLDNLANKIKQLEKLQKVQLEKFGQLKESILNKAFRGKIL